MTQIATVNNPSITQGPRGIGARNAGGAYTQDSQQDLIDTDSFQGPITFLTGTTDAINPHVGGNYIIDAGAADAITIGAPTSEVDDGVSINIWSDSAFAHTLTAPSAIFETGAAAKTVFTFQAFKGSGIGLRAMDGAWHVVAVSLGIVYATNFA
jgi:hypothetical protein